LEVMHFFTCKPGASCRPAKLVSSVRRRDHIMSLSKFLKGWVGEALGAFAHWAHLDKTVYTALNNVTLQTPNGTTQIDHVIVSRFGLIVVEAKNIDGWIFGDANSPQWSIVKPGRKFRMQNPLHQNYRHVRTIVDFLQVEDSKVHSLVMFWGECKFKTEMPSNVISEGYATYIKSFTEVVFTESKVAALVAALRAGAMPKSWATRKVHLASLDSRHTSTDTCPRCGSPLVTRVARSGPKAGSKFYGCTAYPKCRHTKAHSPDV